MPAVELHHVVVQGQHKVLVLIALRKIFLEDSIQIFARNFIQVI